MKFNGRTAAVSGTRGVKESNPARSLPLVFHIFVFLCFLLIFSLVAQLVNNSPAMQETWVQSLGWEDSLERGMATPLQYSCLENSMDRGTLWATVHGVAKVLETT